MSRKSKAKIFLNKEVEKRLDEFSRALQNEISSGLMTTIKDLVDRVTTEAYVKGFNNGFMQGKKLGFTDGYEKGKKDALEGKESVTFT